MLNSKFTNSRNILWVSGQQPSTWTHHKNLKVEWVNLAVQEQVSKARLVTHLPKTQILLQLIKLPKCRCWLISILTSKILKDLAHSHKGKWWDPNSNTLIRRNRKLKAALLASSRRIESASRQILLMDALLERKFRSRCKKSCMNRPLQITLKASASWTLLIMRNLLKAQGTLIQLWTNNQVFWAQTTSNLQWS